MSKGKVRVPKDEKNTRASSRVISLVVVVAIIVLWYLVTKIGSANQLFLPSPGAVWAAFINILHNGYKSISLWQHLGSSMYRMLVAFALATVIAVPLGLASGYIPQLKAILEPIVEFIRPLPPLAYYTLLVLWLGIDNGSKIVLLLIACFMPIYITCVAAVIKIPSNYLHNAASLGANKAQIFFRVVFPYSLPDIFLGMRTAIGVGFTTLVAAEMVAARSGIGWMVLDASNYLKSEVIFAGIIIMAIMGIAFDQIVRACEKFLVPWKGKDF